MFVKVRADFAAVLKLGANKNVGQRNRLIKSESEKLPKPTKRKKREGV